jgi:hypothetical protein
MSLVLQHWQCELVLQQATHPAVGNEIAIQRTEWCVMNSHDAHSEDTSIKARIKEQLAVFSR